MSIRAVICDLGGVVIGVDADRVRHAWSARSSLPADAVHEAYPGKASDAFERDELTGSQYLAEIRSELLLDGSDEEITADYNLIFGDVDTDVVALLRGLRDRGVLVVALTNTNRIHHRMWGQHFGEALTVFEAVHCSHDLRARKPEPAAFQAVLDAHDLEPAEAAFIDDLPGNVQAARAMGLAGLVFTGADRLAEDLRELPWARSGEG